MTSRELVKRTLEFASPERIPRDVSILPWATLNYPEEVKQIQDDFPNDIIGAPPLYTEVPDTVIQAYAPDGAVYGLSPFVDLWGCRFEKTVRGVIGEVKEPLLKNWDDVDKLRMPNEFLSLDVEEVDAFCRSTDKCVRGPALTVELPRPFERLQFIRTTENVYLDILDQPEEFLILLDKLHQFYIKVLELWARTEVDVLWFMDDWGSQSSLLISPGLWRKLFKPLYKDYIDIAHQHGKYALFHSDGYILDILPDLIELGLDAINAQVFCMNVEELGRRFRGKITFWGEIDRQHILPRGSPDDVIGAVKKVKEALYQDGGVIAQCEFGAAAKPENVRLVFETWDRLSPPR